MAVYTQISELLSGTEASIPELGESIEDELPVSIDEGAPGTLFTKATSGFETIHSVSADVANDELLVIVSVLNVSGSNTGDNWQLTHAFNGVRKGSDYYVVYTPPLSKTDGRQAPVTVVTFWQDQTAGTHNADLDVGPISGPTGTFYARNISTHVLKFKRRA